MPKARAAGANFVAAIIHADKRTGAALMNMHVVDLILSGPNHDLHVDFDGCTAFVESEQDANYVSVVEIDVEDAGQLNGSLAWWPEFRIIDTSNIEPEPDSA